MNLFDKASKVKRLVVDTLGCLDDGAVLEVVRVCGKFHYKRVENISKDQARVYEALLKEGYNPDTAYKWLLLSRSPPELKNRLRMRLISQKKAFSEKKQQEQLEDTTEQYLLKEIIQTVERYIIR